MNEENEDLSKIEEKKIELLVFNGKQRQQKLIYAGLCKIVTNESFKVLMVQPENKGFKPISASFLWTFIQLKQILYVFSGGVIDDFALVFETEADCKKLVEVVNDNSYITENIVSDEDSSDKLEKASAEKFKLLLLKQIHNPSIVKIILKMVSCCSDDEKAGFVKLLKKNQVNGPGYHQIFGDYELKSKRSRKQTSNGRKRTTLQRDAKSSFVEEDVNEDYDYTPSESEPEESDEIRNDSKKRKLSNGESSPSSSTAATPTGRKCERKTIRKPAYDFVEVFQNGMKKTRLIIYAGEEKKFCYEYFWDQHKKRYHCCGCIRKSVRAAIFNANTDDEYIMLINDNHICEPREYDSLKLFERQNIIYQPDFEIQRIVKHGIEKRTLVVFCPEDRKLCHKYLSRNFSQQHFYCSRCHNKRHSVIARLCQDDEESQPYVVLGEELHICEPKAYAPGNSCQDVIVESGNIIFISKPNGQSRVFVFNTKSRSFGYEFSETNHDLYMCLGCQQKQKSVVAKLCQKDSGEFYIRMGPNQKHVCQQRKYQPDKLEESFVHPPNFIFYSKKTKRPHLFLYCQEDPEFGYDYRCCANNFFYCKGCLKLKHNVSVKVAQNESDGKEYLRHGTFEHKCSPIEFKDVSNCGIEVLEKSGLKFQKEVSPSDAQTNEDDGLKQQQKTDFKIKKEETSSVFTEFM